MTEPCWHDEAILFAERGPLNDGDLKMILWLVGSQVERISSDKRKPTEAGISRAVAVTKLDVKLRRLWRQFSL
jgi:hypothetical protein